jgi:hypothetical protein
MDPSSDRVVASCEKPGVVGMQAFHADAGAADPAGRDGSGRLAWKLCIALVSVAVMGNSDDVEAEFLLCPVDTAASFKTAYGHDDLGTNEPVARRHRPAIVEKGSISNYDGRAVSIADDDLERALGAPSEECSYGCDVVIHCEGRLDAPCPAWVSCRRD